MSFRRRGRSIGAVLTELQPEFPDLSVSKIRFLENEGLIAPERTAAGYRLFTDPDVDRLRFVLAAQRDRFWPLKVIRDRLDALDRGLTPAADVDADATLRVPAPAADPAVPTADALRAVGPLALTAAELLGASGLDEATFTALGDYGLIRPDPGGHFDELALTVATSAAALAAHGVQPRHLRAFRSAAEREVGLVEQIVPPARAARARRTGSDPTAEVLHHCLTLHVALVKAALRG